MIDFENMTEWQEDVTEHDITRHEVAPKNHSPEWYGIWANRCPMCGVAAVHKTVKIKRTAVVKKPYTRSAKDKLNDSSNRIS